MSRPLIAQRYRLDEKLGAGMGVGMFDLAPLRRPAPGAIELPAQTPVVDGDCGRFVTLPDGITFTVGVTHWRGWSAPLCEVANQAIVSAVDVEPRADPAPAAPAPRLDRARRGVRTAVLDGDRATSGRWRRSLTIGARTAYVQEGTAGFPESCQVEIKYRRTGQ